MFKKISKNYQVIHRNLKNIINYFKKFPTEDGEEF